MEKFGLILLTALAFGSSIVMTRLGLTEIPPLTLALLRLGLATLLFVPILILLQKKLPSNPRTLADIAIVGVATTGWPLIAFTISLKFISSAVLTIFIALIPLFTAIMAHLWLAQEKLNPTKLAGLVVGLTGVIFLLLTRTTGIAEAGTAFNPQGPLLALAGVFVAAASGVYARLRLAQADFIVVTAGQMLAGFLSVLPFAVTLSSLNLANVSWRGGFSVFYTGIIGSFLAFLLVFYMIKHFGATTATLPTYIMPAVSGILGALILGEIITFPLIVGAVIILFGVFLASR